MDHVAIMGTQYDLIGAILSQKKTIESRWYKTRRAPWGRIHRGDTVYFKASGGQVLAKANVEDVVQYEGLTLEKVQSIVDTYGDRMYIQERDVASWAEGKMYCVLVFLSGSAAVTPFDIDKRGFGNAAAWITIPDVKDIRLSLISS